MPPTAAAKTYSSTTARSRVLATRSFRRDSGSSSTRSRAARGLKRRGFVLPRDRDPRARGERDDDSGRSDRPARPRAGSTDDEALRLRETGRSYAAIAQSLQLKRANDALAAVRRARKRRPEDEQAVLVANERGRLDQLEARIRSRDRADPARLERRLAALEALRQSLDS